METDERTFEQAAEHAFGYVTRGELPSALVCVADRTALRRITACNEKAEPDASRHEGIFALASITKSIVGVGVARLVDEGRLRYDDPVVSYIPEFGLDGHRRRITIGHVLAHGAGLPARPFRDFYSGKYAPEET